MSFINPFSPTNQRILTATITAILDQTVKQNRSSFAPQGNVPGMLVFDWSYDSEEANWDSSDELPINRYGTAGEGGYNTGLIVPKGTIALTLPIWNVWEAVGGGATVTPYIGAQACNALTTKVVVVEATGNFVLAEEQQADQVLRMSVSAATMTAGGITMYLPYVLGPLADGDLVVGTG